MLKLHLVAFAVLCVHFQILTELIDTKYGNRVLPNVGLCVCLYDFVHIGDAMIYPGEGSAHTKGVKFMFLYLKMTRIACSPLQINSFQTIFGRSTDWKY